MKEQKITKKELRKFFMEQISFESLYGNEVNHIILIIFPRTNSGINDYFNKVLGYLTPNAVQKRLRIDPAKFTALQGLIGDPPDPTAIPPNTNGEPETWNYVYPLEKDKATFSYPLSDEKAKLILQIKAAILDIYSDIPDSAINKTDTLTLGIKPKSDRKKPVLIPGQITATTIIGLTPIGGGNVEVMIRTNIDNKRASKLNRAADIELAYSVLAAGDVAPVTSDQCSVTKIVTTARYLLKLGENAGGKKLVLFARWVYTKHEEQSGTFGSAATCNIS